MATTDEGVLLSPFPSAEAAAPTLHLQHARRSPEPGASLTTETLYRAPPTTIPQPPPQNDGNGSPIPIAAIAGGAAAGALLAIVVVIGWVWWGRQIKKDAAIQRMEAVSARVVTWRDPLSKAGLADMACIGYKTQHNAERGLRDGRGKDKQAKGSFSPLRETGGKDRLFCASDTHLDNTKRHKCTFTIAHSGCLEREDGGNEGEWHYAKRERGKG